MHMSRKTVQRKLTTMMMIMMLIMMNDDTVISDRSLCTTKLSLRGGVRLREKTRKYAQLQLINIIS